MKKKVKSINLKQATMVAFAATMIMANITNSLQPVEAAYRTPTELSKIKGEGKSFTEVEDITDIWFKAIYGKPLCQWDDYMKENIDDRQFLQELWNRSGYKGDVNSFRDRSSFFWGEITKIPYASTAFFDSERDKNRLNLDRFNSNCADGLTPHLEYIPTMEFKVGSKTAYIDGKKFELEAPVIRNKSGDVLVPMYHLGYILTTCITTNSHWLANDSFFIMNPITANNPILSNLVPDPKSGFAIQNGSPEPAKADPQEVINKLMNLYGNDIQFRDGTVYVPFKKYFSLWNPQAKFTWDAKKQVAKMDGRYTPQAKAYGIFTQPGVKSVYDPFKDWEMVPQQPVASKY